MAPPMDDPPMGNSSGPTDEFDHDFGAGAKGDGGFGAGSKDDDGGLGSAGALAPSAQSRARVLAQQRELQVGPLSRVRGVVAALCLLANTPTHQHAITPTRQHPPSHQPTHPLTHPYFNSR